MSNVIIDDTKHDDPKFLKAQVEVLQENLLNCHNELQIAYGAINNNAKRIRQLQDENVSLKIELSIHGIEFKDQNDEESI